MIDYFALLDEARRPWLDPNELKEKYFARARIASADAGLNEAFRVLSDPKLRLQHLLTLEGAQMTAGRPVPPSVAELFWNTGTLLREIDRWLLQSAEASSALSRALLSGEKARLERKLEVFAEQLDAVYADEIISLREIDNADWRNDRPRLVELHDSISYLTRLRDQVKEKRLGMANAGMTNVEGMTRSE
ncbi:MAG: hypothetical protein ACR2II_06240 [Chthoniobacterales bacterium]